MKYSISKKTASQLQTDGIVILLFEKEDVVKNTLPSAIKNFVSKSVIKTGDFKGKKSEMMVLPVTGHYKKVDRFFLIGLGEKEKYNVTTLRNVLGKAIKNVQKYPVENISILVRKEIIPDNDWSRFGQTVVEGVELGSYKFDNYKSKKNDEDKSNLKNIEFISVPDKFKNATMKGIKAGEVLAASTIFTRNLGNHPSNVATPKMLAETAKSMANELGMDCEILTEKKMQSLNMNALLAVAKGSKEPPQMIILEYIGSKKKQHPFIFVGKGVTFDSGGISLKPGKSMDEMKYDMSGGGTVLGIMKAVASLNLQLNVVGIVPAVENLPSGSATKPGDIVKSMSGTTIEVLNTDAEGRMILADALTYAEKYEPKYVINLATLTGAVVVAIGNVAAGIMGNDEKLVNEVKNLSDISGEKVWPFPLFDEYKEQIKSKIADIKNIGQNGAGVTTAGAFLSNFTDKYKWAHIDIAGVAWTNQDIAIAPKGATGFGVRLLVEWLRSKV